MKFCDGRERWIKRIPLLASFLVPLLITIIICIDHEVFPFGDQCILHIDMYHQYCPFFTELMDKLKHGGSLFYSWNIGLGADFISLYAYYLASPLNWLLILCPGEFVIEFMTILVVLRIALCGLTFGYYLKCHFHANHFAISIFGSAYALSAFMAAYAWNIMWTDCLVLAPLIVLGLERLVKEKKAGLYYTALSLCILSNYYISIMICIFLVIWFFIYWIENRETGAGAFFRFAGYSLLAGGTGAVLIIPEAIVLGYSGSQHISFPDAVEWYFDIISELARHSVMTEVYTGRDHWPNIYCGVFVLILFLLYLFNRRISWKRKLPRLCLIVLFVISFANNILDFIWHGMHFPDSLPGRQSFLYIFVLLAISYETFLHLKKNRLWHVGAAGVIAAVFMAAVYRVPDAGLVSKDELFITAIFLGCYVCLIGFYIIGRQKTKQYMLGIGCFAILAELTLNFDVTGLGTTSRTAYTEDLRDYKAVLSAGEEQAADENLLFYRTEEMERKTKNDAALSGYRSATQFSSLMNLDVSHFYQNVGMEGGKNFYCVNGVTPLISSMLSIKYLLADNPAEESPIRTLAAQSGNTYLYENKYCLPLGFMMDEEAAAAWNYENAGDIGAQNELAYLLGAEEPMLTAIPSESEVDVSTITVPQDGYIFAIYEKTDIENLTEETDQGYTKSFTKVSHGYTLDLGYCTAGTTIKIKNTVGKQLNITAYYLNLQAVETAYRNLSSQTMEMTSFSDTKIEGSIEVTEPGRLVFSIAKEEGWSLFVDGRQVEPESFGGAFISVYLKEGSHRIVLKYKTPGFAAGAAVSGSCIALFAAIMLYKRRRKGAGEVLT